MEMKAAVESWPIATREGLSPTTIRILFVIDGRIFPTKDNREFGLGYVLETLRSNWTWWVRFEVDIATRETNISPEMLGGFTLKYRSFKFNQTFVAPDGFGPQHRPLNIENYDQIWLFADQPNETDGSDDTTDADIRLPYRLDELELKALAEWMDRGGGVFATGDHGVLGASMCSKIPRVGTMRKWTQAQNVPSVAGPRRHQTWQGSSPNAEVDLLLQPVELVYSQTAHRFPFLRQTLPHPVMCSTSGPIDRFPDHMHEGEIMPDAAIDLHRQLSFPGYDRPEYPVGANGVRPQPLTIAYGRTTNLFREEGDHGHGSQKRFGLVNVYDGDGAGIGRVICDSTWHHWLSVNIAGIALGDWQAYRKMQVYYRNVGLWLASPAQRQAMLVSAVWGVVIGSPPMLFAPGKDVWAMGEDAVKVLEDIASPCWINGVVDSFLSAEIAALRSAPIDQPSSQPSWSGLPSELINRAVVGSLCKALIETAWDYRKTLGLRGDTSVDFKTIQREASKASASAHELLRGALDDAVKSLGDTRNTLALSEERKGAKTGAKKSKGDRRET